MSTSETETMWRQLAACKTVDPAIMFPDDEDEAGVQAAKAVCDGCPGRTGCLNYALVNEKQFGVWGGMTPKERESEWRKRRRAARKVALQTA